MKKYANSFLRYLIVTLMALLTLFPIVFLVLNSFKSQTEIVKHPMSLPKEFSLEYIVLAVKKIHLGSSFVLTLLMTVFSVALIVLISSSAAWMMVRFKSKIATFLLLLFTAAMLIPFQAIMYPLIHFFDSMGLKNVPGLILMYGGFGLSLSLFLYHGFIKGIPISLEEAAIMDGAHPIQVYFSVIMPLLKPTTMTVIILNSMWIWNDYLLPFLVIGNSRVKTLTLSVYFAKLESGQYGNSWDLIFPAVLITILPVIGMFLVLQKNIIKGIADGAVK
ncbi:carbohydrate ABC transporter permease [Streptococcus cuniculi]|uniref:Carbohydrate ABC transporter permease n=1 Tax=Streptococcus cuniculi TaxID=1432788 RepID=A0A4Y9J9J1_9STRE|nr:carbohydrate ABC transporter permease [Streptococcus cuniculi]MBF0778400.1 carbohydrate ABC transporter permease [Streptococcus cuniculi]TFU97683.1 carbohydrate ABC transporter permease [Streptococcus cuniculi]